MPAADLSGARWRKSSRSGHGSDGNCVEVALVHSAWRKSSRSGGGSDDNCVEVAFAGPAVAIRDSKNPDGPALVVRRQRWLAFTRSCQH